MTGAGTAQPAQQVVLVTGGGSGIGAASAATLVDAGATVVVCGRRETVLSATADSLGCHYIVADCAEPEQAAACVREVIERFGRLDALVCSAGAMVVGSVLETTPAEWDRCLRGNVGAAFNVTRAALPHLERTAGSLVLISSIAALRSSTGSAAYAAAKAATISLAQAVAVEHGPSGVRANVICPGWVRTEMADAEMAALDAADVDNAYVQVTSLVPSRRPAEPIEIAQAVLFLSGSSASYVNGAVLVVDGGTTLVDAGTVPFDFNVASRPR